MDFNTYVKVNSRSVYEGGVLESIPGSETDRTKFGDKKSYLICEHYDVPQLRLSGVQLRDIQTK